MTIRCTVYGQLGADAVLCVCFTSIIVLNQGAVRLVVRKLGSTVQMPGFSSGPSTC